MSIGVIRIGVRAKRTDRSAYASAYPTVQTAVDHSCRAKMALSNHLRELTFSDPQRRNDNTHMQPQPAEANGSALERGDEIVQQLSIAKYALAVGDTEQAMDAIDAALTTSRGSLSELAVANREPHNPTYAGSQLRSTPAAAPPPDQPDL
jgi:hypothetical protein